MIHIVVRSNGRESVAWTQVLFLGNDADNAGWEGAGGGGLFNPIHRKRLLVSADSTPWGLGGDVLPLNGLRTKSAAFNFKLGQNE